MAIKNVPPAHSFTYDGARINVFHVNKGEGLPRHSHIYAHASFCTAGSVIIRKENKELVMDKTTQPVNLKETEWHEIEALEDNTVFINVFADKHNG
jgi:quercetin dioxygenase-like cupin family protein